MVTLPLYRRILYSLQLKETSMQYKTITLELLRERTELYEQLRLTHKLLPTLETWAAELKASHETWMETLTQANPGSDPSQIASEAMEMAIKELEDHLPPASTTTTWSSPAPPTPSRRPPR